jgi:site-specific DNA-methyltransferase (adenine-specific)
VTKQIAYNIDCMEYMKTLPDKAFELAIVDPPYGINRLHSGGMPKSSRFIKWERKHWDNKPPSPEYFKELFRVSRNQIIWGGNYFTDNLFPSMGWVFWFKQKGMTFADGELAWTSFQRATRQYDLSGMGAGAGADKFKIHPTQKPIKLYEWLLTNYAKQGDKILDTHLGSGSSRIAAYNLGFDFVGCEIDKDYYEAQEERFQRHTAQIRLFDIVPEPTAEQMKLNDHEPKEVQK